MPEPVTRVRDPIGRRWQDHAKHKAAWVAVLAGPTGLFYLVGLVINGYFAQADKEREARAKLYDGLSIQITRSIDKLAEVQQRQTEILQQVSAKLILLEEEQRRHK